MARRRFAEEGLLPPQLERRAALRERFPHARDEVLDPNPNPNQNPTPTPTPNQNQNQNPRPNQNQNPSPNPDQNPNEVLDAVRTMGALFPDYHRMLPVHHP